MYNKLKFREKLNKQRGITLIALIIIIIVLLILAGVAIAQLTGSGLLEKAKLAKEKQENAQIKEDATLADYENKILEYVGGTRNVSNNVGKLLWTNPDLTATFVAQTITLNDSIGNYKYLKILFFGTDTSTNSYSSDVIVMENKISGQLNFSYYQSGWAGHPLMYRYFEGEDNEITFDSGYSSGGGNDNTLMNTRAIPYYVIGYNF